RIGKAGRITGAGATVTTPSGGAHLYFTGSGQRNATLRGHHIDYRATGGYVVAPPSTVDGKPYQMVSPGNGTTSTTAWRAIRTLLDPPPDPAPFTQPAR